MNILHHKSWHVRNKDNINRVRRDEANAAEEERKKLKRQEIAESEARLNILRSKSSNESRKKIEDAELKTQVPRHVILFEQEQGKFNNDKNPEAEIEKKVEKEKFEKKIGLLKYLVDEDLDLKNRPWYLNKKEKPGLFDEKESEPSKEVDLKRKLIQDPLTSINTLCKEDSKHKKKKLDKSEKKSKAAVKESSETQVGKSKTIEQLRVERLKRESEEKLRVQQLLNAKEKKPAPKIEIDDRKRKYNNQFNPEFSKF